MIEIWITQGNRELHRQHLSDGRYVLGRGQDNEITIKDPNLSRHHLRLEISDGSVTVTDLGSTNGTRIDGRSLVANRPAPWPLDQPIEIGDLILHGREDIPAGAAAGAPEPYEQPAARPKPLPAGMEFAVVSAEAHPSMTYLGHQPLLVGTGPGCAIRLQAANVAMHHCTVTVKGSEVQITNLAQHQPTLLSGQSLALGQTVSWSVGTPLMLGSATLVLTMQSADADTRGHALPGRQGRRGRPAWRNPLILASAAGVLFVCLALTVLVIVQGAKCESLTASCLFSFSGGGPGGGSQPLAGGRATPTLAPFQTRQATPTSVPTVELNLTEPAQASASTAMACVSKSPQNTGWLDLPFPYKGTEANFGGGAEDFRRISQRSRFGGRINSFFDHEFPVYPPVFGGREPENLDDTLVIFNGVRSADAYSQDSEDADWYSGHSGIDFAPANPRDATTPVLAPADGRLLLVKVDDDDNHMVWLEHDPDGDGRYQYATMYFHLHPDEFYAAMLAMEPGTPISAGQRIGTMGTTGRSSGIHLHFEVREDINRDGTFSIFERVDPYGWFPGPDLSVDPWSVPENWTDVKGNEYDIDGITSDYLWIHPLVEVVDVAGGCQQVTNVKVDLYNVLGWAVVDPGFTYIARNEDGEILQSGPPHRRTITILPEDLDGVDPSTLSLEWLNPNLDTWFTHARGEPEPNSTGGFTFGAIVDKTGRYVLVAKETVDRVPPATNIELEGEQLAEQYTFKDSVKVTLTALDRGLIQSPIKEVQYSLDCGQSWHIYDGPFTVTQQTSHACGEAAATSETIELDENDFLLLAMSEDSENNIEQPPAQIRFRID
jgi:murein DD-endopeptidase MepM/ murein hydrolase activator NlpD